MKFPFLFTGLWILIAGSCKTNQIKEYQIPTDTADDSVFVAKKFCSQCHLFPTADLLDKITWQQNVLPNMGYRLGIKTEGYSPYHTLDMLEQTLLSNNDIYPEKQLITQSDWKKILSYYLSNSPDSTSIEPDHNNALRQFEVISLKETIDLPKITMLYYDSIKNTVDLGLESGRIFTVDGQSWKKIDSIEIGKTPINFASDKNGLLYLLTIGKMYPSEQSLGEVYTWDGLRTTKIPIINQLHRPVSIQFYESPFQEHMLISEFGYETGKLSRFYSTKNKWQEYTPISKKPGAVKSIIADIDNDDNFEVIALLSQGDEQVISFKEKSKGRFESKILLRFHPLYGACDLDMADMNDDGFVDLVVSHGDNADYSIIVKPYHGINIYLNNGKGEFAESSFLPYPGVLHSELADFDQDGDIDIAATSFFPGDLQHPVTPFKYFMNEENKFVSSSFEASEYGKWMNMVAGDFDTDGDKDILLGSFLLNEKMLKGNHSDWRKHTLVLLKNTLK